MDSLPHIDRLINNPNLITFQEGRKLTRQQLVNILNFINFQDGTILINFRHRKYHQVIPLKVKPLPCLDDVLECRWADPSTVTSPFSSLELMHILISDGLKLILVQAEARKMDDKGLLIALPESCYQISARRTRRHPCRPIEVEVLQKSSLFKGRLIDFSPVSFAVELSAQAPQSFRWIDPDNPVHIILRSSEETVYSGECAILRQSVLQDRMMVALAPVHSHLRRVAPKEFRCMRHKLSPSPAIVFTHPLTGSLVSLRVDDISSTGFSVEEYNDSSVLIPGLVIPDLAIELMQDAAIRVKAQVIYRNLYRNDSDRTIARCGCVILDMDIQDQMRLSAILHPSLNNRSFVCGPVDLDRLWKFFFEAGFVYPKKYAFMHANKEKFRETYEKLYLRSPEIFRHFIFQDKGVILSHLSMLRFYEKTWLIHHLAASKSGGSKFGLLMLDQIGIYTNEFCVLKSAHMDFLMCYFRPENKFPNRIFGGVARDIRDPKGSSLDTFAYFHIPRSLGSSPPLSATQLAPAQREDILELERFYEHASGGLLLAALDLTPSGYESNELNQVYATLGFTRLRKIYALKREGMLCAIITVTLSDAGLNLSGLVNCIHVIIIEPELLLRDTLYNAISFLSQHYQDHEIPALLYPYSYAEAKSIPFEKAYNLWVLDTSRSDDYFSCLDGLVRKVTHE